jgi:DNA-binding NarL/FixJ family response regulator
MSKMSPYRIVLVEDHAMIRETIKKSLEEVPDLKVVGELNDGLEVLDFLKHTVPDMIILDLSMPNLHGFEATKLIKSLYPKVKILILTMHKTKMHVTRALECGADGYIVKENALSDLIVAIEEIRAGKNYMSSLVTDQVMDILFYKKDAANLLSKREIEILTFIAEGKSSRQIAQLLSLSHATVNNHRTKIKNKLGFRNTSELVKYAIHKGYASVES